VQRLANLLVTEPAQLMLTVQDRPKERQGNAEIVMGVGGIGLDSDPRREVGEAMGLLI